MTGFKYTEMPESYMQPANRKGTVHILNYPTKKYGVKYAYVYTPYGYNGSDMSTRYDIIYLMHGANSGTETFFWGDGLDSHFKNMLDHMIENGEMRPAIVVTPGLYPPGDIRDYKGQEAQLAEEFTEELINNLIFSVESMYLSYADALNHEGFCESRAHRIFAGFSMGAVVTWYTFAKHLDCFSAFIPMSGDCWKYGPFGGEHNPEPTAQWLADSVRNSGFTPDDFKIYMATGTLDMAFPGLTNQLAAMKKHPDIFNVNDSGSDDPANLYYTVAEGGVHDYIYAYEYLRCAFRVHLPAENR